MLKKIIAFSISTLFAISTLSCSKAKIGLDTNTLGENFDNFQAQNISKEIVVRFKSKIDDNFIDNFAKSINANVINVSTRINTAVFEFSSNNEARENLEKLNTNPIVDYAEPNYIYTNKYTVSDPKSKEQNGLAIAGLAKAWDITFGDPRIIIAIVDTGVDLKHPDLKNKLVQGYNVLTGGKTPPMDDNGHGTHAAGIAGAETNNRIGIAGTAPKCRIMPIKALDKVGNGNLFDVSLGIVWAVDHGARVLNLSLGGPNGKTLERAVQYALMKNVVVVAAMGNDGKNKKAYPAAFKGVIAVGSIDFDKTRSSFSNYGDWISVVAPGSNILSTMPTYNTTMTEFEKEKEYDYLDGTSMATPIVSGIVALMLSRNPNYTPAEVKSRLESTAIDLGKKGYDIEYGHGLVNALKAVL
jgi:subtilisin family serine protease